MTTMTEMWLPVVGYEGLYDVSDEGNVRGLIRGQMLSPGRSSNGYLTVSLSKGGKQTSHCIQYLVLEAFEGPRPEGLEACHWDDVGINNRRENLRWDTSSANKQDSVRNGTHHCATKTHCKRDHEFTPENTDHMGGKARRCRECRRIRGN